MWEVTGKHKAVKNPVFQSVLPTLGTYLISSHIVTIIIFLNL